MFGKRFRKWLPLALVLLVIAGGIALMFFLPEPDEHAASRKPRPLPMPTESPVTSATPSPDPATEPTPDPEMADDSTDSEIIPQLPNLLEDDDDKEYPAPFSPPEKDDN